ncbi:multidrug resistance protein E, partial [Angomonas deanei]
METFGHLRFVGHLRQSDHPRRMLAGVEWQVAPRFRRNASEESGAALHNGTVHGEFLFTTADDKRCGSLEPVEDVVLLSGDRKAPPPPKSLSMIKALFISQWRHLVFQLPAKLLGDLCGLLVPVLIERFVNYLQDDEASWAWGIGLTILFFIVSVVGSCATHKYDHISIRAAAVFEIASYTAVFEKCLMISKKSLSQPEMSMGRIMNMAGSDVENLGDLNWYVIYFISAPIQLIVCLIMLFRLVGWSALGGVVVILITFPVQSVIYKWQQQIREKMASVIDNRLKKTNELLSGIRIVKFMGWEPRFIYAIEKAREQELAYLKQVQWTYVCNMFVDGATPILVISVVFVLYHLAGNTLEANVVFPVISLLNIMRVPFFMIPVIIGAVLQCLVSSRRLSAFLECENFNSEIIRDISRVFTDSVAAAFDNVNIQSFVPRTLPKCVSRTKTSMGKLWNSVAGNTTPETEFVPKEKTAEEEAATDEMTDDNDTFLHQLTTKDILKNVNLIIPKGKLTMVVGETGSGKSTLLASLLGEYGIGDGNVYSTTGQMVYVPQLSWIMNATLEDNIAFFNEADEARISETIRVCQLEADVKLLSCGLKTEIGEKGINLSGGQKAR